MRVYAAFIYVFLYAPIALIVVFSFNAGHYAMDWQGFSVEWYGKAFANPILTKALKELEALPSQELLRRRHERLRKLATFVDGA